MLAWAWIGRQPNNFARRDSPTFGLSWNAIGFENPDLALDMVLSVLLTE
jgi:hypothetical protein